LSPRPLTDPTTHEREGPLDLAGRYNPNTQVRCAMLANNNNGPVAFSYDMVGWADVLQTTHADPNVLALQLWKQHARGGFSAYAEKRGPQAHRHDRGNPAGGTQTMLLTAVDERIAVSAPAVMCSAHFFGGCKCESGMPIHRSATHETNNVDIAAMAAPRPQLLISIGTD